MARTKVQAPDGRTITVEHPDGASEAEIIAFAQQSGGTGKDPKDLMANLPEPSNASIGQRFAADKGVRLLKGLADPFIGAFQGGANIGESLTGRENGLGTKVGEALRNFEEYRKPAMPEGMDWHGLAGNIATLGSAGSKIPAAKTYLGKILQGMGVGGSMASTMPVTAEDYGAAKGAQIGVGTLTGGIIPAVAPAVRMGVESAAGKFAPGSGLAKTAAGRYANQVAGDRKDPIIDLLRQNRNPVSQGTAGEVASPAGSAEFSALQKVVSKARPSEYAAIQAGQNQARQGAIQSVGGTPESLKAASQAVDDQVAALYQKAFDAPIAKQAYGGIGKNVPQPLLNALDDPFVSAAKSQVDDIASAEGVSKTSTRYFHLIKKALDDIISKPPAEGGLGPTQQRAAMSSRDRFLTELEKANPAYGEARRQSAELYKPVSQMKVGQYVGDKLSPAMRDFDASAPDRAATFAQALRDAPGTLKRATGFKGNQALEDVMTPQQMETFAKVGQDLGRMAEFERLARGGSTAAKDILEQAKPGQFPGILERTVVIMNSILGRTGKRVNAKTLDQLSKLMQNPQEMAKVMDMATTVQKQELQALIAAQAGAAASGSNAVNSAAEYMENY